MEDVIVVGAGPAGNNAALGLAARGLKVTVIDWRHNIGDKLCTGIVGSECIRRFPVDPALVRHTPLSAQLVTPMGENVQFETAIPQACVIDRAAYVDSFAQRARVAGARYLLGHRALEILPDQQGVTVITDQDRFRARSLVLAAGFGSPLIRQIGLGPVSDYVTGIQAEVCTKGVRDVEVYLGREVAPGFFSWLVPTQPDRALVGLLARRKARSHVTSFIQRLERQEKVTGILKHATSWGIPLRPLKRTYRDRTLVVGDAAGQVKPTTGGGIYYSLLSSEIAVDVLSKALEGDDLSSENLSAYQARWRALLAQELDLGYSARRLYEYLTDQQITSLVRQAGANGLRADLLGSSELSFDWHSRIISKVLDHQTLGGVLRLINPILARLGRRSDVAFGFPGPNASPVDSLAQSSS